MNAAVATADTANDIARKISYAQTRAYLSVQRAWLEPYAFDTIAMPQIVNQGASPARWVEIDATAQATTDEKVLASQVLLIPIGKARNRRTIDPGAQGREYSFDPDCGDGKTLKQLHDSAFGKKSVVLQRTVRWETVFGEIFESTFSG